MGDTKQGDKLPLFGIVYVELTSSRILQRWVKDCFTECVFLIVISPLPPPSLQNKGLSKPIRKSLGAFLSDPSGELEAVSSLSLSLYLSLWVWLNTYKLIKYYAKEVTI